VSDATTRTPQPPDIGRRTLTPFGYVVVAVVPLLIAAIGFTYLHFHYDKEDLVDGKSVPILTSDWQPGDDAMTAEARGELTLGDDGCVRIGDEVVVWPADYEATVQRVGSSDQLKVYDPDRDIVARSGQTIEVGGGYGDLGEYAGRQCAPDAGDVFYVQSAVKVVDAS
jgi:hypothetical protein